MLIIAKTIVAVFLSLYLIMFFAKVNLFIIVRILHVHRITFAGYMLVEFKIT